jgi:SHS family lactate transporter-like MFS transporter
MTGFNFLSHGSQDLYPKMVEQAKGQSTDIASKATIIGNCGAVDKSSDLPSLALY